MTIKMVQTGDAQVLLISQSLDDAQFLMNEIFPKINEYNENRRKLVYGEDSE